MHHQHGCEVTRKAIAARFADRFERVAFDASVGFFQTWQDAIDAVSGSIKDRVSKKTIGQRKRNANFVGFKRRLDRRRRLGAQWPLKEVLISGAGRKIIHQPHRPAAAGVAFCQTIAACHDARAYGNAARCCRLDALLNVDAIHFCKIRKLRWQTEQGVIKWRLGCGG